jgi:hypothetical protein
MSNMERFYLVPCECSARVPATVGQAGERVVCAACGRSVAVPRFRDLVRLDVAGAEAPDRAAWDPSRGLLFAGGVVAIVAAIAAFNVHVIGARFFPQPPDAHAIRTAVQAASPVDIHAAWHSLVASGVRRSPTEEELRLQQFTRSARGVAAVLWASAGIAAAVAVAGGLLAATRRSPPGTS